MKQALSLMYAMLLAVSLAGAQDKDKAMGMNKSMAGNDAVKTAVASVEKSLRDATLKSDTATIEKLLADDYHGFSAATMQPTDKNTVVGNLKSGKQKFASIDVSGEDVQVYSATLAVAHGEANVKMTMDGKPMDGKYHFGRVWAKRAGKWQAVWFQSTKLQ